MLGSIIFVNGLKEGRFLMFFFQSHVGKLYLFD